MLLNKLTIFQWSCLATSFSIHVSFSGEIWARDMLLIMQLKIYRIWSRDVWRVNGFGLNSLSSFLSLFNLHFIHSFPSFKMSSPPHRQSRSPAPQALTVADELARMMREVTPLEDDEGANPANTSCVSGSQTSSPSNHGTDSPESPDSDGPGVSPSSGPMRSIEQRAARRLADRLNLFPYQKDALNELVKVLVPVLLYAIQVLLI